VSEHHEGGGPVPRLPMTAGALLVNGTIYSHTSMRGDVTPAWHPIVRQLLQELPVASRERFAGWCAEAALISDRLYEADQAAGRHVTGEEARSTLAGAQLSVHRIREDGDPAHGQPQPVCRTCAALLSWFGITAVTG
jgi:YwqJ-like deaminase